MNASLTPPLRPNYSIVRVEKIKTFAELERRSQHNDRTNMSENVDPVGPSPRSLLPDAKGTLSERARDLLNEVGIDVSARGGKIIACEMVLTASKPFFATCTEREFDTWVKSSADFAKARLGRGLIDIQLHMDEETPHIHAIGVPVAKRPKLQRGAPPRDPTAKAKWEEDKRKAPLIWTLSYDAIFGGSRDRLSELQDEYHRAVGHLGLSRGDRSRSDKTVDLGDGIEIDAAPFGRGQNTDGTTRSRRNITPKKYRELIKQRNDLATLDAQESRRAREASEDLLGQALNEAERAATDMRAAKKALEDAQTGKLKAEAEARAQHDIANMLRAEADRLLDEARAEKAAAVEEAAAVKVELKQERDLLDRQRQQDQVRLGLLERAVDDQNGLNLRPEGDAFVMDVKHMTPSEQTAYVSAWPRALFEIARKLANVMAKIRSLLKFVSDKDHLARLRDADVQREETRIARTKADIVNRETALFQRESSITSRNQETERQLIDLQHREGLVGQRELAMSSADAMLQAREQELLLQNQANADSLARSRGWADILELAMGGDLYIEFDQAGLATKLVPSDQAFVIPPEVEKCFSSPPPSWAQGFLRAYRVLDRQAESIGSMEEKAIAHEKRLSDLIESAGPVLSAEQQIEVQRIEKALAEKASPAEIAARLRNAGMLR